MRSNPFDLISALASGATAHIGGKMAKKLTNPGGFIPVKIVGNKIAVKLPNRNPGTLAKAKNIAKRFGARTNSINSTYILYDNKSNEELGRTSNLAKAKAKANRLSIEHTKVDVFNQKTGKIVYQAKRGSKKTWLEW